MTRSLFLLKRREDYSQDESYSYSYQIATGMWNSAHFVVDVLQAEGKTADIAMVVDANSIDGAVVSFDATHAFIEGLWVTPTKFAELLSLARHAGRKWVVRIHSEIPFLSTEGVAMDWISQYLQMGVIVAPNAPRAHQQIVLLASELGLTPEQIEEQVPYLPNCYPTEFEPITGLDTSAKTVLDVGCFGAFRPFKNHLQQVFIASRFATALGLPLRFHTNMRADQGGLPIMKNVDNALASLGAEHVKHGWEDRDTFIQTLKDCDLLLQLSMTETFNIVAADNTLAGRPMLVSDEITWAYNLYGDPQNVDDCVQKLFFVWGNKPYFINRNRRGLIGFAKRSATVWNQYV